MKRRREQSGNKEERSTSSNGRPTLGRRIRVEDGNLGEPMESTTGGRVDLVDVESVDSVTVDQTVSGSEHQGTVEKKKKPAKEAENRHSDNAKAPEDVVENFKAPEDVVDNSKVPGDVVKEAEASEDVKEDSKAPEDVAKEVEAPEVVGKVAEENSEDVKEDSKAPEDVVEDSRAPEDVGKEVEAPEDVGKKAEQKMTEDAAAPVPNDEIEPMFELERSRVEEPLHIEITPEPEPRPTTSDDHVLEMEVDENISFVTRRDY